MICLGAGITCADGVPVETIVDNRNLGASGTQRFVKGPNWAHLEDHGGWVLLGREPKALREDRTGAWSDINTGSTPERRTRRWQTLWLDHGTDPEDATYAYVLMPGASRRAVARRAADRHWMSVLANDPGRQAVTVPSLGCTAANFWRSGAAGPLTASAAASVLIVRRGHAATLCVSEPPRTGAPLEVTWDRPVRRVDRADDTVEMLSTGRRLRVRVTPGTVCATHICEVTLA